MRLILKVHEASAAKDIKKIILILAAVYIFLEVILEGLRNLCAVSSILCSLFCNFCSLCKLLVFRFSSSSLLSLCSSLCELCLGIFSIKVLGSLIVLFKSLIIIIIVVVALCRPSAIRCTNNSVYTLTEDSCLCRIAADELVTYDLLAGNDRTFCSDCDINIVELITLDDTGSIRRCLLYMDNRAVKLRNRNSKKLLARLKRYLRTLSCQRLPLFFSSLR